MLQVLKGTPECISTIIIFIYLKKFFFSLRNGWRCSPEAFGGNLNLVSGI